LPYNLIYYWVCSRPKFSLKTAPWLLSNNQSIKVVVSPSKMPTRFVRFEHFEAYICPQHAGIVALSNHINQNGPLSVITTLSMRGFRDLERCEAALRVWALWHITGIQQCMWWLLKLKNAQILTKATSQRCFAPLQIAEPSHWKSCNYGKRTILVNVVGECYDPCMLRTYVCFERGNTHCSRCKRLHYFVNHIHSRSFQGSQ
jgi:hypothetical protein